MNVHPHSLRMALTHVCWVPERACDPEDSSPAGQWKRLDGVAKGLLNVLLNHADQQVVVRGDDAEMQPVLALPAMGEKRPEHFLSIRTLGNAVAKSARHVRRTLARLESLGVVQRELREWLPSRFYVCVRQLQDLIRWNEELTSSVDEWRRRRWRGEVEPAPKPQEAIPEVGTPVPPPSLVRGNRAARRAALGRSPGSLPVCPECPKVGRLGGVRDRPALVAWALQQADANLARFGLPEWAARGAQHPEQAHELARLVLGWVGVQQGEVEGKLLPQLGGIQARSLAVLWRGAGSPQAEVLLGMLAQVYWAHQNGEFDVRRGNAVFGYWFSRPKWRSLLRPSAWIESLETAQAAYTAAQAAAQQEAPRDGVGKAVRELFAELGLAPLGSALRRQVQQELDLLAQGEAERGNPAWAELIWAELGRSSGADWSPDPELGERLVLPDGGVDPPS